jgi:hypothetical protein
VFVYICCCGTKLPSVWKVLLDLDSAYLKLTYLSRDESLSVARVDYIKQRVRVSHLRTAGPPFDVLIDIDSWEGDIAFETERKQWLTVRGLIFVYDDPRSVYTDQGYVS